ncbi:hypothetical protein [Rubinisphaera margarita]|uniref:hypothetical protein n=1 Tax=Rubinisphaera margarita TaxID=2909586 RepID=UPI001EE9624C|nr:hypothetical protein [Rubinisphaera margarita]MCG6155843.1 hypothetical protein [Rubinisphaera margarita]
MRTSPLNARRAFTLVEITLSLVGTSVLVGGMMSALYVTMKSLDPNLSNASVMLTVTDVLHQMRELQFTTEFLDQMTREVEVWVPDRDDDDDEEKINYRWSGIPGDPLIREYNGHNIDIVPKVYHFSLSYISSGTYTIGVTIELQSTPRASDRVQIELPILNKPRTYQYDD